MQSTADMSTKNTIQFPVWDSVVVPLHLRYREVVVIVPMGNYNQAQELGRYMHEIIARNIIRVLNLPEYKMFYLDTGEEVLVH
jgi:uncharacterized protein YifN (PemK superfamily)